ncbi:mating-type-like pheromone receptor [Phlebiopsis gigantea 11061_1 CR5-6]|uniref:Mating-type-like pheromone receptor n=1 Tax=Phlebiopsis gigantea (strain 11061_1 CR5-6) TaxID=745531 RepID=A0A0C3RVR7_PHLG1|nr:mating-type-like pheromone receptor [Phlebiopsis gigantea 11061_1 CR5-6]
MVPWQTEQTLLTAFSFIAFCLVSVPLYWHLEAWNVGCVLYIGWVGSYTLIQFINCVVWRDNAINWAPVWCDIVIRIMFVTPHAILAASLVINRRLYKIASTSSVSTSRAERRRAILIDLAIGMGIPIATMIIMWFIQGHRFNIYEGIGPLAPIPNTYFQMFVTNGLCIIIGLVSSGFCIGTLRAFLKRRRQFSELLKSNNNLTFNRYLRLMALAGIELLATIPLSVWLLVRDTQQPIYVWRGLGDMHSGYSRIEQYPTIEWMLIPGAQESLTLQPWLTVSCAFVFFVFFGLAEEARTHYRLAFTSVAKRLGLSTGAGSMGSSSGWGPSKGSKLGATIPSFVQRSFPTGSGGMASRHRRDSLDSFSDKLSTDISIGDLEGFEKGPYSPTDSAASAFAPTPTDGNEDRKPPHVVRPDSGVVVGIEIVTDRRSVDVPKSVRDDSHMV